MPWRFSAHGKVAEVRGRAREFFQSEAGHIHNNLAWPGIHAADKVHQVIERYLGNRSNEDLVTVKASLHGIFAAPITAYPEPVPVPEPVPEPVPVKSPIGQPMVQPKPKRKVPLTRSKPVGWL